MCSACVQVNKDVPVARQIAAADLRFRLPVFWRRYHRCWSADGVSVAICRAARRRKRNRLAATGTCRSLNGVEYLRPGATLYRGIELADPETGRTIFRSRCLEVVWRGQSDEQGRRQSALVAIASQPEVEAAKFDLAVGVGLQRLLESRAGRSGGCVEFSAGEIDAFKRAGDRRRWPMWPRRLTIGRRKRNCRSISGLSREPVGTGDSSHSPESRVVAGHSL